MKKARNIFWGIFFIAATIFLIASQLGSFIEIGFWSLFATVILVAIIIQSAIYRAWWGIFISAALVYLIYQAPLALPYISPWILIIGSIFLSIGFHFLFKPKNKYAEYANMHINNQSTGTDDDNNPIINVNFGNTVRYLRSDCLKSGTFTAHFGNLEVYFDQARLDPEGAEIYVDCNFGAIKLFVPRTWLVIDKVHSGMGGVSTKNHPQLEANPPTLTITGSINMGGLEIMYI